MGLLTLISFRADIVGIVGRNPGDVPVNRWINMGYMSVASLVDFEILDKTHMIATAATQKEYDNVPLLDDPTFYLGTKSVYNTNTFRKLEWLPLPEFLDYDDGEVGAPKYWTTKGNKIALLPVPTVTHNLEVIYKAVPTQLSADGDTTVLPANLDEPLIYMAASYAFSTINEEQRANYFEQRALVYIQTHITEDKIQEIGGQMKAYPDLQQPFAQVRQ